MSTSVVNDGFFAISSKKKLTQCPQKARKFLKKAVMWFFCLIFQICQFWKKKWEFEILRNFYLVFFVNFHNIHGNRHGVCVNSILLNLQQNLVLSKSRNIISNGQTCLKKEKKFVVSVPNSNVFSFLFSVFWLIMIWYQIFVQSQNRSE